METYTVAEISYAIRNAIVSKFKNKRMVLVGEISNFKTSNRHTFLTLKDDTSAIDVAFWGESLKNSDGENVEIIGKLNFYTKASRINFVGEEIKNIGVGEQHAQYNELKEKYEKLGYFDNKKPLPKTINKIGIVTSQEGAALQDFLYVLNKNNFPGEVYVYNCIAQGTRCPGTVAAGVKFFNSMFYISNSKGCDENNKSLSLDKTIPGNSVSGRSVSGESNPGTSGRGSSSSEDPFAIERKPKNKNTINYDGTDIEVEVDLIIVTRGGGSFEDLMGFSHPKVIESIHKSEKYVISAVGHEVDDMLSDYVANYRAPTPSIAGEVVSKGVNKNKERVDGFEKDIMIVRQKLLRSLYEYKIEVKNIQRKLKDPLIEIDDKLSDIESKVRDYIHGKLSYYRRKLLSFHNILKTDDPTKMLEQGFMVLTDSNDTIVSDISSVFGKTINLTCSDGRFKVMIKDMTKEKTKSRKRTNKEN